jgi:diguanylate cyclase (GGDEF)-like protein/PAS domain S-box-containing protein
VIAGLEAGGACHESVETQLTNRRLLVVDRKDGSERLCACLLKAGYSVESAANSEEALERVHRRECELVILDGVSGEMGMDLLRLLRATYSASELAVIVAGAVEDEMVVEALELGANDCLTEPLSEAVALARIRSQLDRRSADEAMRTNQERLSLVTQGANDGIWDWDLETGQMYLSARWKEMLGYGAGEFGPAQSEPGVWLERIHADDRSRLQRDLDEAQRVGGPREFVNEHRLLHRDGSWHWFLTRGTVLRDGSGKAIRMAGFQTEITLDRAFDPLTGLANRVLFVEMIERALEQSAAEQGKGIAVLLAGLDRFKLVNDSLGHAAGDRLLQMVAWRLDAAVHSYAPGIMGACILARIRGDEFGILVPEVSNAREAEEMVAHIQKRLAAPIEIEGRSTFTSSSVGIALSDSNGGGGATGLIRDAYTAMHRAKSAGKSGVVVYDPEMRGQAQRRFEIESDLRFALEQNQFELRYQPKVDLGTRRVAGLEALLRWRHPVRGLVPPSQFIPITEETGMIIPVGLWVLRESCARTSAWHKECPGEPVGIAVNLSVRQFRQPDLVEQVSRVLSETGLEARFLQLEVTESLLADDSGQALRVLRSLKELGTELAIDDFGTGYSSLNYLVSMPIDAIKIDRSFVVNMLHDEKAREVVKAIIALAHGLGKEVVAEGIENEEQLEQLLTLGCRLGQGYHFAKPLEEPEITRLLTDRT